MTYVQKLEKRALAKLQRYRKEYTTTGYFDYQLLFLIIFLVGFGLVMLYSVSTYEAESVFGNAAYYVKHQAIVAAAGFVVMMFIAFAVPLWFWKLLAVPIYWISVLLCALVLIPGFGSDANGSSRWLEFGPISFQPSEIAKVAVILFLALTLSQMPRSISKLSSVAKILVRLAPLILVIAYNNLSTAIIIAGIAVLMMFVSSKKYSHYFGLAALVVVAGVVFIVTQAYRSERILAWLAPEDYPDTAYQTLQGLYAIGSGGLFGKGLGSSLQKLDYVPEAQNDFIFTIICEELGVFGGICVILLFVLLIWRFMVIILNASDLFGSFLVTGVMVHISLQVVLNLAVVTNSIPNTGITLPFISYGGSSLLILMAEMGLVLAVSRQIRVEDTAALRKRRRRPNR